MRQVFPRVGIGFVDDGSRVGAAVDFNGGERLGEKSGRTGECGGGVEGELWVGGGDCAEGRGGIGWRVLVLRQVIEMIGEGEGGVVGGLELVGNEECRPRHRDGMGGFI